MLLRRPDRSLQRIRRHLAQRKAQQQLHCWKLQNECCGDQSQSQACQSPAQVHGHGSRQSGPEMRSTLSVELLWLTVVAHRRRAHQLAHMVSAAAPEIVENQRDFRTRCSCQLVQQSLAAVTVGQHVQHQQVFAQRGHVSYWWNTLLMRSLVP